MRTHEFINEITYSNSISDSSNIIAALNPTVDTNVGIVDHHPVYVKDGGNCIVFYLTDQKNVIHCYILVEKNKANGYYVLRQVEKISDTPGIMMALIQYLVVNDVKLIIKDNEPITHYGLKWITNLINNPRGLNIHDGSNRSIDPGLLDQEWVASLHNPGHTGKISIYIESKNIITNKYYCFEDQRNSGWILRNHLLFIGDKQLL
jgi:hypothetical protein